MDAIYARQSIDKKGSLSIEGQIELCRKFTAGELRIFSDRGFSGKNMRRPAFGELMEAVEAGEIERIVVYRLDRFSRSLADFSRIWEVLQKNGVAFLSVSEQFDTSSPVGRAMLSIVMTFAQLERETTAERVRDNYHHRASLGAWPGGPAPYGYALSKAEVDGRSVSSLIPDEHAKTVCRIFEEYAKPETSLRGLAKDLTARGIHGPKREAWDNVTLSRILRNPVYVRADEAVYCYYLAQGVQSRQTSADYDGEHGCVLIGKRSRSGSAQKEEKLLCLSVHEGIVSAALWLRVQEKLSFAAQLPRANAGKYSWLTGLLKCAKCGYAVKINSIKAERRCKLLCSGRSNLGGCDASIDVDLRELEAYIAGEIQRSFDACPMELLPAGKDRAQAGAILEIERKIDRLVAALAESSAVAVPYISQRIDALHAEREQLLHAPTRSAPLRRFDFQRASFDEKKLIAAEFVERIMLDGERVHIIWKA